MYSVKEKEYAGIGPSFEELTETEMQDFDGGAFTTPLCVAIVAHSAKVVISGLVSAAGSLLWINK